MIFHMKLTNELYVISKYTIAEFATGLLLRQNITMKIIENSYFLFWILNLSFYTEGNIHNSSFLLTSIFGFNNIKTS